MDRGPARLLGQAEDVFGDLVAWGLLLLGVVFGLATLPSVALLTHLGSS